MGFEPTEHYCSRVFETRAFGRTMLPLLAKNHYSTEGLGQQNPWDLLSNFLLMLYGMIFAAWLLVLPAAILFSGDALLGLSAHTGLVFLGACRVMVYGV